MNNHINSKPKKAIESDVKNHIVDMVNDDDRCNALEHARFLINTREKFLKNYRAEFGQLLIYCQNLMSILGIFAGFGFTAFQFIKTQLLFF